VDNTILKPATEWIKDEDVIIYDPDGFRWDDNVTMDTPISQEEFKRRLNYCTVMGLIKNEN
jgi:hypothetical protein